MTSLPAVTADALLERLRVFAEVPGPSGREEQVRDLALERWRGRVDAIEVDRRGNVVAELGAGGPRLALVVHMDEVGWVVRHITDDGFLLVDTAQGSRSDGPPRRFMVGHDVVVFGRSGVVAEGVFAASSGHVAGLGGAALGWSDFWVELGLETRAEAEALGIHVGSPVVFSRSPRRVGSRIVGKAMDDRIALCAVDMLLERLDRAALGCRLTVAATVHEEGGLHGAHALAASRELDLAVVLEIGLVGDIPSVGAAEYEAKLGAGPTLVHKDGQIAYDRELTWKLADIAAEAGIDVQHGVWSNANTDGVPLLRAGVPTALVGIPTRYTHTAFETVDPGDVLATVGLLAALVASDLSGLTRRRA